MFSWFWCITYWCNNSLFLRTIMITVCVTSSSAYDCFLLPCCCDAAFSFFISDVQISWTKTRIIYVTPAACLVSPAACLQILAFTHHRLIPHCFRGSPRLTFHGFRVSPWSCCIQSCAVNYSTSVLPTHAYPIPVATNVISCAYSCFAYNYCAYSCTLSDFGWFLLKLSVHSNYATVVFV